MHLVTALLAGLTASAFAAPTSRISHTSPVGRDAAARADVEHPANGPLSNGTQGISTRDAGDDSVFCSEHSPALTNAIGRLCSSDLRFKAGGHAHFKHNDDDNVGPWPAWVRVRGTCDVPTDPSDDCMLIMWKMCAATIKNGYHGAYFYSGPNRCLEWSVLAMARTTITGRERST